MAKKAKSKKNVKKTVDTVKKPVPQEEVKVEEVQEKKAEKKTAVKTDKKQKKNSKDKRHFWKDFKAELKKVVWPTPKQLVNNTAAVLTIVIIVAIIVVVLDLGFEALNKYGVNNLRKLVAGDNEVTNTQSIDTDQNVVEENGVAENSTETTNE